jgi:hypothetical protein
LRKYPLKIRTTELSQKRFSMRIIFVSQDENKVGRRKLSDSSISHEISWVLGIDSQKWEERRINLKQSKEMV